MVRWEVETQDSGITDTMRIDILSATRTSIETIGSSEMFKIAESVKKWLDETYGSVWDVIIGKKGQFQCAGNYYHNKFLRVYEKDLGWTITVKQQIP